MHKKLGWLVAALALPTVALGADGSMFKLSGFGTVGMTHSSESDADFRTGLTQPNGPGRTAQTTWDTDSKFGVQADVFLFPINSLRRFKYWLTRMPIRPLPQALSGQI